MESKINYKVFGEGEPVIIMHGLLGMLDNWQTFAKKLGQSHMVYTLDLRNHGRSFHHGEMDYPIMAEDLRQFMEDHHMFRANILGHSMGGKVAMEFALQNPDMVNKLMVADISPAKYPGGHEHILDAMHTANLESAEDRDEILKHLMNAIEDEGIVLFLMKNLSRNKGGGFRWKANLEAISDNYQNILDEVNSFDYFDAPTLFIKGGQSKYLSDPYIDPVKDLFSRSQIREIPDAGHWVHADAPSETMRLVKEFLDR
ncbi:MAG: alpha/beta fold hydrolase [Saprospirales bacterium]|nr:MAG: alpha/beta fold hydrolase [Saprospirales bacterium]